MSIFAGRRTSRYDYAGRTVSSRRWANYQLQGGASRPSGHSDRGSKGRQYRPGDTVRQSGIFEILHDREHREAHEAVMISGEKFPDCETCKDKVRFRLVRTAPYIFQDEDFEDDPV